jgi:hypothetical protein
LCLDVSWSACFRKDCVIKRVRHKKGCPSTCVLMFPGLLVMGKTVIKHVRHKKDCLLNSILDVSWSLALGKIVFWCSLSTFSTAVLFNPTSRFSSDSVVTFVPLDFTENCCCN